MTLTSQDQIDLTAEDKEIAAINGKINDYWRNHFAEQDEDEGSPYREDDHVGELGWNA